MHEHVFWERFLDGNVEAFVMEVAQILVRLDISVLCFKHCKVSEHALLYLDLEVLFGRRRNS